MSKIQPVFSTYHFLSWILLIFLGHAKGGIVAKEECDKIGGMEVRYNEFYELYLGNDPKTGKLIQGGIVYRSLKSAVNACCSGMELTFTSTNESVEHLVEQDILHHHHKANETRLVFYFPEFTKQGNLEVYSHRIPFLKLRKSPGLALVMLRSESHLDLSASDILKPSWPIFVLIICMSWAVGILGWLFDHVSNPEEFPKPFIRGMFDGFWWAIVTMTTVGYGDKAPKSILARLLAVVWILAGAVIISVFTANTTSIITTYRIEKNAQTVGKKIGVVNMKDFVESELNLAAKLIGFTQVQEALTSLKNKTIDRLLFPHYLDLLFLMSSDPYGEQLRGDIYIAAVYDKPFQIGMVLSHGEASSVRNDEFYTCLEIMTSYFSRKEQFDYSNIDESLASADHDTFNTALTLNYLYAVLGPIGGMILLGSIYDLWGFLLKKSDKSGVV